MARIYHPIHSKKCPNCLTIFARPVKRTVCCSKPCAQSWRNRDFESRFWSRAQRGAPESCWEWTGTKTTYGYGVVSHRNRNYRTHRFAWRLTHGAIPAGLQVLHRCDNPPCCNPHHLFIGTQVDNMADMERKGRSRRARGSRNGHSKLTEKQVYEILRMLGTQQSIADMYGVSQRTISQIKRREHWKHVESKGNTTDG